MPIFGMLRVKNEGRWLGRVLDAIKPACDKIWVFDDHSTDDTMKICRERRVHYIGSHFSGLDESRDKDYLLSRLFSAIPDSEKHWIRGNPESPYWALAIDGDEELVRGDAEIIKYQILVPNVHAYHLRIPFLWNDTNHIRIDRVYKRFEQLGRPSLFRLMNAKFRFLKTPFGRSADGKPVNFHCSSIPQELLHHAQPCAARLLHWGYLHKEDRIRKWQWYNTIDPNNSAEDRYRHIVQGDVPEVPIDAVLKHAGPLQLAEIQWQ